MITYHMTLKFCLAMSSMNAQLFLCRPQASQLIIMLILVRNRRKIHNQFGWWSTFWAYRRGFWVNFGNILRRKYSPHDHMDRQRLNTLYRAFHGSVAAEDFVSCDEMAVGNMEAGNLIAMLDDACLKIVHLTLCKQIDKIHSFLRAHSMLPRWYFF